MFSKETKIGALIAFPLPPLPPVPSSYDDRGSRECRFKKHLKVSRKRERRRVPSLLVTCAFVASMEKPKCFLYSMYAWPRAHSRKYSVVVMRGIFNPICSCVTLQNYA